MYVSTARPGISQESIYELMQKTKKFNDSKGIDGLLLFSEGNFLQVIEGEKEEILKLWDRIQKDPDHYNVIRIFDRSTPARVSEGYKCDFVTAYSAAGKTTYHDCSGYLEGFDPVTQKVLENLIRVFIPSEHRMPADY